MNKQTRRIVLALAALAALIGIAFGVWAFLAPDAPPAIRELWVYEIANLADPAELPRIEPLWRRAAAAGYAKVVLVDPKFARLDSQDAAYFARIGRLRTLADSVHLEIVPGVCLVGRGNGALLARDPNLAEAIPVRNALFEVRGGIARLVPDPPVAVHARPDRVDPAVSMQGGEAVMSGGALDHVAFVETVSPWRCYHFTVLLRGQGFSGEPRIRVTGDGHELAFASIAPPRGDSLQRRDVVFDSQDFAHVTVSLSVSRASHGELRWSGWTIEEVGPVNAIRRPNESFRFTGLVEGRDYEPVSDPLLGERPWRGQFDAWHPPPVIRVKRPDGTRLRGSWHMAAVVGRGQVADCLSDPAVTAALRDEITRVKELFGARTLFLMHDEIRCIGQDSTCRATHFTPAEILAANVRACRRFAGDAKVCVWNDMFDPEQNAVDHYYLVRGNLKGSWAGLDSAMTIVNWNGEHAESSLRTFARAGHPQVWAGYYDGPVGDIRQVLPLLDKTPGVTGVMYTTWQSRYDDLEAFAKLVRGE